jgi:hypothetical protein
MEMTELLWFIFEEKLICIFITEETGTGAGKW